jgi:hypothetical protein
VLKGVFTVGWAGVVAVYRDDAQGASDDTWLLTHLDAGCDAVGWPQGSLCDEPPTTDSPTTSTKSEPTSGAYWGMDRSDTAVIVVDACINRSCDKVRFDTGALFQADHEPASSVRFSVHRSTSDTPPRWNQHDWIPLGDGDWTPLTQGIDVAGDGVTVTDPTAFTFARMFATRYVRVELATSQSSGTQLRNVKLFGQRHPAASDNPGNVLRGMAAGGHAAVVVITGYRGSLLAHQEDPSTPIVTDLSLGCDAVDSPQGTLCDELPFADDPLRSSRDTASGGHWDPDGDVTGVLIVDACADGTCSTVDLATASLFQNDPYLENEARISVHDEVGGVPPAWDDEGWVPLMDYEKVTGEIRSGIVQFPLQVSFDSHPTRYVRIESRNQYAETGTNALWQVKAFER